MRIGVVGVPGGWSSEALVEACQKQGASSRLIDSTRWSVNLESGAVVEAGEDLRDYDALVIKKLGAVYSHDMLDRVEVLRYLADSGVLICSPAAGIARLLDRMSCTLMLRSRGIPMPATCITEDVDAAVDAMQAWGEVVLKPLFSSKARGMRLLDARALSTATLKSELDNYRAEGNQTFYIQKKLPCLQRDLGVAFLGGEYLGTYARVAGDGAWNTTIHSGGRYEAYQPPESLIELARRAQAAFELDFTSVDVVETPEGPLVFEVSAFGGFRGLRDALGIDAAERYAAYVMNKVKHYVA